MGVLESDRGGFSYLEERVKILITGTPGEGKSTVVKAIERMLILGEKAADV